LYPAGRRAIVALKRQKSVATATLKLKEADMVTIKKSNKPKAQKDIDKRIFRFMAILNMLNDGLKITTKQLAADFNVEERTIQRDMKILRNTNFPILSTRDGRHSFMEAFSLKMLRLTDKEASLLAFLQDVTESLSPNFIETFKTLTSRLIALDADSPYYAKLPHNLAKDLKLTFLEDIEDAIDKWEMLEIEYTSLQGNKRTHNVCPLKIINYEGFWYLLTLNQKYKDFVKYRLENISSVTRLDEHFEPPENIKTILDDSVNIWFQPNRSQTVTLSIDKEVAHYFKTKQYFPLQKITKENKDGSLTIETQIATHHEILHTIFNWLPNITILSPQSICDEAKKMIADYLKKI
jgi:predicted DNA-binding transcriptional regulator YafY